MKSTREVAIEIVSLLRGNSDKRGCLSFYDFKDCSNYTEMIAATLDEALEEGGGVCS
ncbi:MAG: hypothetical protein HYS23_12780 [Geobacter sp.]|nr:hypothetical protein [Geobacter sp.]